MEDAVHYEHSTMLTEQQKAALRLHGAFLGNPAGLGPQARADVLDYFTAPQIVELAFKFIWWSTNKATVTLGDDAPHDSERLTAFHYDEDGAYVVHTAGD